MHRFTEKQKQFIKDNVVGMTNDELTIKFNLYFGLNLTTIQIKNFKHNHHLKSGLNMRFKKGGYMKILTNNQYNNFMGKINELVGEIVELQSKYGLLKANYNANINVIKELNGRIGGLTKENNRLKEQNEILVTSAKIKDKSNGELAKALSDYSEIIKERDSLNVKVKELEKKLEESLSDAYFRIKLPAVKAPNSQKMKVKSHAVKDRILKKYIDDLEKNG